MCARRPRACTSSSGGGRRTSSVDLPSDADAPTRRLRPTASANRYQRFPSDDTDDAGADGAYERGGFRERLNQLAPLGCGGWRACLGGETELMRLDCGKGLDGRRPRRLGHLGRLVERQVVAMNRPRPGATSGATRRARQTRKPPQARWSLGCYGEDLLELIQCHSLSHPNSRCTSFSLAAMSISCEQVGRQSPQPTQDVPFFVKAAYSFRARSRS